MHLVVGVVAMVATILAVTAVCDRFRLPSPLVMIVVGIVASYLSFVPAVDLNPEVVLLGMLPPLLYASARSTSLVDFNANRRPILLLSVGLVVATTLGVGFIVHWLVPDLHLAVCFAIGAVVAPPDAVAATAIGRRIGLPRRIVTILEGESLLNDATALVSLRTALGVAAGASLEWTGVLGDFIIAAVGGVVVGLLVFIVVAKLRRPLNNALLDSGLSFITPFAAYVAAEEIHASGVIAVVVAGLLLGHKAPIIQTAQSRIQEEVNWGSIAFLLESSVFLLIGLQARQIVNAVADGALSIGRSVLVCVAVLVGVIVIRMAWVFATRFLLLRPGIDPDLGKVPTWRSTMILGWAGMRGVVTLAAAFIIPKDTPHRDLLLLIAFAVTAGTLFLQGMTLPWLARTLKIPSPDPAQDALARADLLEQAGAAGMIKLNEIVDDDPYGIVDQIRDRLEQLNFAAWEAIGAGATETPAEGYARLRGEMIQAEREHVLQVRSTGTVAADVVRRVLAMLDIEESMLDYRSREDALIRTADPINLGGDCEHLREEWPFADPVEPADVCPDCVAEGLSWVHLRQCTGCGNVGCCDSSVGRHATRHYDATGHPVMRSVEPGEAWRWCYVDQVTG